MQQPAACVCAAVSCGVPCLMMCALGSCACMWVCVRAGRAGYPQAVRCQACSRTGWGVQGLGEQREVW